MKEAENFTEYSVCFEQSSIQHQAFKMHKIILGVTAAVGGAIAVYFGASTLLEGFEDLRLTIPVAEIALIAARAAGITFSITPQGLSLFIGGVLVGGFAYCNRREILQGVQDFFMRFDEISVENLLPHFERIASQFSDVNGIAIQIVEFVFRILTRQNLA